MAAKKRYGNTPHIKDKEKGSDTESKVENKAESEVKKETTEEKPMSDDHGSEPEKTKPKADEEAGTGKVPVHVMMRHAHERHEMNARHMMEHQAMHGRHEREHAEAIGGGSGEGLIEQVRKEK